MCLPDITEMGMRINPVGQNMKKFRYALLVLAAGSLVLFAVNVFGKGVFLNVTIFQRILVVAASQGVCHLAATSEDMQTNPMDDVTEDYLSMPDIAHQELINLGPISVSAENRLDPLSPFRFGFTRGDSTYDYSAVEFPWLLIPVFFVAAFFMSRYKKHKAWAWIQD